LVLALPAFAVLSAASVHAAGRSKAATAINTLFPINAAPANAAANDAGSVELGVAFSSDVDGYATGLRFFKGPGNTGTHVGTLWTSTGTALAHLTFTNETTSGWQTASFSPAVELKAHQQYIASYHATQGHYAFTYRYFKRGYRRNHLSLPASSSRRGNGLYQYSATVVFPTASAKATNYWVDVTFSTTRPAVAPTTTGVTETPIASSPPTVSNNSGAPCSTFALPSGQKALDTYPCPFNTGPTTTPTHTLDASDRTLYGCSRSAANALDGSCPGRPEGMVYDNEYGFGWYEPRFGDGGPSSCTRPWVVDGWSFSAPINVYMSNGTRSASTPCVTIRNSAFTFLPRDPSTGQVIAVGGYPTSTTSMCQSPDRVPCGPLVLDHVRITGAYNVAVGSANYYVANSDIDGGGNMVECDSICSISDSYMWTNNAAGNPASPAHLDVVISNGFHAGSANHAVLSHNTMICHPTLYVSQGGGCSVMSFAFYSDFGPVNHLTIDNNFIPGDPSSFNCVNTSVGSGKAHSNDASNGLYERITNNVVSKWPDSPCNSRGGFDWECIFRYCAKDNGPGVNNAGLHTGNRWCNNRYTDGTYISALWETAAETGCAAP
jgi:hypothetical protein